MNIFCVWIDIFLYIYIFLAFIFAYLLTDKQLMYCKAQIPQG